MFVPHDGGPNAGGSPSPTQRTSPFTTAKSLLLPGDDDATLFTNLVRVDINRPSNDTSSFPIKPSLNELLAELTQIHSNNIILPIDEKSKAGALAMASDIPSGDDLHKYVSGIQHPNSKATKDNSIRFFLRISATMPLWQLKRNTTFYAWLQKKRCFLRTHGFTTTYDVTAVGFLSRMSPTLHRRERINEIIQAEVQANAPELELRLVPRNIPYGKDTKKTFVNAVEIQVDRANANKARELMVKIFGHKPASIPSDIYFVPNPTNGTMSHDLYFQHLQLHHQYTADLRSFAITNVRNIHAELTVPDPTTGSDMTLTFEQALLTSVKPGTNDQLFTSIEPTKDTESDGRYLLVTKKDLLADAQQYIDHVLNTMAQSTPDDMARITQDDNSRVTRTNRVHTSTRFQSYAHALQNMIPTTITTSPPPTAWKRRPTPTLNLTDDEYPALDTSKKPRMDDDIAMTDTSTTHDATETLTTIDLDEIENSHRALRADLERQVTELRMATEAAQKDMRETFAIQMGQLELRIEKNTKTMLSNLSQDFQAAVNRMAEQVDRTDQLFKTFKDDMTYEITLRIDTVLAAIQANRDGISTPKMGSTPLRPDKKKLRESSTPPMYANPLNFDTTPNQADGSLNPTASRAIPPQVGNDAQAGASK